MKKTIIVEVEDDFTPPDTFNESICKKCPLCYEFEDDYAYEIRECTIIEYERRTKVRDSMDFKCPIK